MLGRHGEASGARCGPSQCGDHDLSRLCARGYAHTYALEGRNHRARTLLASLLSDSRWGDAAPYSFAVTYAALGQKDSAFRWLQRSVEDRSCTARELNNDHGLDPLRSDPRFSQIAR
jgi:hypothetical protein